MIKLNDEELLTLLKDKFNDIIISNSITRNILSADIMGNDISSIVNFIYNDSRLDFPMMIDLLGVDYLKYEDDSVLERYAVIYIFYSFKNDLRLKIRAFVSESNPEIDSIYSVYKGADWTEREIYDMYGITFKGHPNLKRLLMPEGYGAHPLRKDYPLKGLGERSQFPKYNIYNMDSKE